MVSVGIAVNEDIERNSRVLAESWRIAYRGIISEQYLDALTDDHWVSFLESNLNQTNLFVMVLYEADEVIRGGNKVEFEVHLISFYCVPTIRKAQAICREAEVEEA